MKLKRLLAAVLSGMIVFTSMPITTYAGDEVHSHSLIEDGDTVEFEEYDGSFTSFAEDASYYLTEDITISETIVVTNNATVNLCLNGYSITQTDAEAVFNVVSTFNLCDCSEHGEGTVTTSADMEGTSVSGMIVYGCFNMYGGNITGYTYSGVCVKENGTFNMYGGKISGNSTSNSNGGGGVVLERAMFTMYGGEISGNTSNSNGGGVAVGGSSVFNMEGGKICGNTATNGGGVVIQGTTENFYGVFNMNKGEISGNTATYGGGLYIAEYTHFIMKGGTISGNSATEGGGVYIWESMYGNVELVSGSITGNHATSSGGGITKKSHLSAKITISGTDVQVIDNCKMGRYDEESGKYVNGTASNVSVDIVVSEELDSATTKIGIDSIYTETEVVCPDEDNIDSLAGMEACFVSDQGCYVVCNENGALILTTEIMLHQPTTLEPYVVLDSRITDELYQWYEVEYDDLGEVTNTGAEGVSWDDETISYYDEGNGWIPVVAGSYYEYFKIDLEAGDIIQVVLDDEVCGTLELWSSNDWYAVSVYGAGTYTLTVPTAGNYVLCIYGEEEVSPTLRAYLMERSDTVIESETTDNLTQKEIGKSYYCKVVLPSGEEVLSDVFEYTYAITHQPTAQEPWVELNDSTGATYQWYEVTIEKEEITNETAESYSDGTDSATYNEETGWSPYYEYGYYFFIELEAGETLAVEIADDTPGVISLVNWYGSDYDAVEVTGAGTYTLTAPVSAYYIVYSDTGANLKAYHMAKVLGAALEGENDSRLQNLVVKETYCCKVVLPSGDELMSDVFEYTYAITHQPTAQEPWVELNDSTGASYQWYTVEEGIVELTSDNTSKVDYGQQISTYDSENGWSGVEVYTNGYEYFTIDLDAGESIEVEVSGDINGIGLWDYTIQDGTYEEFEEEEYTYILTANEKGSYTLYVTSEETVTVKAYKMELILSPIVNQTTDTLVSEQTGAHVCEVTFKNGTKERSKIFCVHDWTAGTCTECWESHECTQYNEDGKCPVCGNTLMDAVLINSSGRKLYKTVLEAIAEAEDGDTVQLLDKLYIFEDLDINKSITLDLNGNVISTAGSNRISVNASITLKDSVGTGVIDSEVIFNSLSTIERIIFNYFVNFNVDGSTAEDYLAEGYNFHSYSDGVISDEILDVTGATDLSSVAVVARNVAVSKETGNVYYDTLEKAMKEVETGDTVLIRGANVSIDSLTVPEGVTLEIVKGAKLTVEEEFINEGSVQVDGTLVLSDADYDINGLTNAIGSGTVIIDDVEYTYIEETEKFGCRHTWGKYVSDNNATCTADGTKTASCDNGCGTKNTIADTGSAKGHKYTNYKSDNNATCTADGTKTATCDNGCGTKNTIADTGSAKGHKYTNYKSDNNATCTADGTKTASCDNGCGTKNTIADTGSKKAHADANKDGKCDVGGETLTTATKTITYKIAFDGNGATSGSMKAMSGCVSDTEYNLTANAFNKTGYTFNGWNTKKDGSGKTYKNKASVKNLASKDGETVTLYAQWKKTKYTITYKLNGGKNNSKNKASYYVTTSTFKFKNPTRTGYTFKGWYTDKKCTKKITQITKGSAKNYTLYAKWEKTKYTITYVLNGGKNNSKNKTSYYVTTSTFKLKNPTRKGYTFKGWYSDKKCTKKVTKITKGSAKNLKLYAKWEKKK